MMVDQGRGKWVMCLGGLLFNFCCTSELTTTKIEIQAKLNCLTCTPQFVVLLLTVLS